MRKTAIALAFILVCFAPAQVHAWGAIGHRVVGEVADYYLSKKAKRGIKKILGFESIAMASNWADFVKSDKQYNQYYNWHFVNLAGNMPKDSFYIFIANDTATDLYTKTNWLINELKNNRLATPEQQQTNLRLLIHFVGDMAQPMHLGHVEDKGGNSVKVTWFNTPSNLHRVWDENLIEHQQLSYTEYANAIKHISKKEYRAIKDRTMVDHLWHTYQVTNQIYEFTKPDAKLWYEYDYKFQAILNNQLLTGGIHLASILEDIF